jgi:hypothetical protein
MVKRPARSTITLRGIAQLQNKLSKMKALQDSVKDKRKLVSEAVKILEDLEGTDQERGEHTGAVYYRLMHLLEIEIEAEWANYLKRFREEQDRGNGQIAAAWPDEEA